GQAGAQQGLERQAARAHAPRLRADVEGDRGPRVVPRRPLLARRHRARLLPRLARLQAARRCRLARRVPGARPPVPEADGAARVRGHRAAGPYVIIPPLRQASPSQDATHRPGPTVAAAFSLPDRIEGKTDVLADRLSILIDDRAGRLRQIAIQELPERPLADEADPGRVLLGVVRQPGFERYAPDFGLPQAAD